MLDEHTFYQRPGGAATRDLAQGLRTAVRGTVAAMHALIVGRAITGEQAFS
jgi:hypothetical protein